MSITKPDVKTHSLHEVIITFTMNHSGETHTLEGVADDKVSIGRLKGKYQDGHFVSADGSLLVRVENADKSGKMLFKLSQYSPSLDFFRMLDKANPDEDLFTVTVKDPRNKSIDKSDNAYLLKYPDGGFEKAVKTRSIEVICPFLEMDQPA